MWMHDTCFLIADEHAEMVARMLKFRGRIERSGFNPSSSFEDSFCQEQMKFCSSEEL
jgi:hypothetical protein